MVPSWHWCPARLSRKQVYYEPDFRGASHRSSGISSSRQQSSQRVDHGRAPRSVKPLFGNGSRHVLKAIRTANWHPNAPQERATGDLPGSIGEATRWLERRKQLRSG
jgi:hypothetical protein